MLSLLHLGASSFTYWTAFTSISCPYICSVHAYLMLNSFSFWLSLLLFWQTRLLARFATWQYCPRKRSRTSFFQLLMIRLMTPCFISCGTGLAVPSPYHATQQRPNVATTRQTIPLDTNTTLVESVYCHLFSTLIMHPRPPGRHIGIGG